MFHLVRGSVYLLVVLGAFFSFLYISLVTMLTYIVLIFEIYIWYMFSFTYLSMCYIFSFLNTHVSYVCNFLFLFHIKMPWWILIKMFLKDRMPKSIMPWILFLQSFLRVCVRIRFYCTQQVIMSLVIYAFSHTSFVCCDFVTNCQMERLLGHVELVRTYVM